MERIAMSRTRVLTHAQHVLLIDMVKKGIKYDKVAKYFNLSGRSAVFYYRWRPIQNNASATVQEPQNSNNGATQHDSAD